MQHKFDFIGIVTDIEMPRQISDKLELCNMVCLEGDGLSKYPNHIQFEAANFTVPKVQDLLKGDKVHIQFVINSREWENKYYTSLRLVSVTVLDRPAPAGTPTAQAEESDPFSTPAPPRSAPSYQAPELPMSDDSDLPF